MQETTWRERRGGTALRTTTNNNNNSNARGRPAMCHAQGAVSVRHIYDVLRLSGPVLLTRSATLLGLELPNTTHQATHMPRNTGGGGGIARRMQGVLQRPASATPQLPGLKLVFAAADTLHHLATAPHGALQSKRNINTTSSKGDKEDNAVREESEGSVGETVATLSRLVAWYCLATTPSVGGLEDTQSVFHSSHASSVTGTGGQGSVLSGQTTPHSGTHTPTQTTQQQQQEDVNEDTPGGGSAAATRRAPRDAEDWFGSRMSNSTGSSSCSTPNTMDTVAGTNKKKPLRDFDDAQLAAQLVRPAVYAVARYSTYGLDTTSTTISSESTQQEEEERGAASRVRESVLWLLAAVLTRFPCIKWDWSSILPPLFPSVDVRVTCFSVDCGSKRRVPRHPLLTPMLYDIAPGVRHAASLVIAELLSRSNRLLRHAAEADLGRQSAFASLASQAAEVLRQLHEALDWGLEQGRPASAETINSESTHDVNNSNNSNSNNSKDEAVRAEFVEGLLFPYATLVASTPYQRCPRSQKLLLHTLQLPVLRLNSNTPSVTSTSRDSYVQQARSERVTSMEHNATMHFLVQVLNNEWLIEPITALLTQSTSNTNEVSSGAVQEERKTSSDRVPALPWLSLVDGLLANAMSGTEAWSCVVQLARVYPSVVQAHFDALLAASTQLIERYVQQLVQPRTQAAPISSKGTTSSHAKYVPPSQRNKHVDTITNTTTTEVALPVKMAVEPRVSAEVVATALRGWLHFMGYTWHAFDEKPKDPAFRPAARAYRATLDQKARIYASLLQPLLQETNTLISSAADGEEVLIMVLRCVAQIGQDFVATVLTDKAARAAMVSCALRCRTHWHSGVRAEAMTTMGMWLWQYAALDDEFALELTDAAVGALREDSDALVRGKAAFVLSNATSRLDESSHILRRSPAYVQLLCDSAVFALSEENDQTVRCHGARMMNFLFQVLTFEELIAALTEHDEVVAEGFFRLLLQAMQSTLSSEPKLRWNCVVALGTALSRVDVFEAEPRLALAAVQALTSAVEKDAAFKVRIQAANALSKLRCTCLAARFSSEDMTPIVVQALCAALVRAEQTENFQQYQDKDNLRAALKTALQVMITSAAPSNELAGVFAAHKQLLTEEGLL